MFFWNGYAHYIADRTLQSVILACSCFRGSYSGFTTAEDFEKVLVTVTDSAANRMKVFDSPVMMFIMKRSLSAVIAVMRKR